MNPAAMLLPRRNAPPSWALAALLLATLLILFGCSGGEPGVGSSGTGLGTSGTQIGSVNGFGSVIVEGTRYDESAATVTIDMDPAAPAQATADALRLGMLTELSFEDDTRAARIVITPTLVGPIDSVATQWPETATIRVAGQTVRISNRSVRSPVFEGFDAPAQLAPGDWVVVHGTRDDADRIDATRVERLADAASRILRIVGDIGSTDSGGFTIGAFRVEIGPATLWIPALPVAPAQPVAPPATGQRVTIHAGAAAAATAARGTVMADSVRLEAIAEPRRLRLGGRIRASLQGTGRFRIDDVLVDAANAQVDAGTVGDLTPGAYVRIDGMLAGGVLQAERIRIIREADETIGITGIVSDFVAAGSFRVRRTLIDASSPSLVFEQGSAADLADGVLVEVRGEIRDGTLHATRVRPILTADDRTRALAGVVVAGTGILQPDDGRFTVAGIQARLTAGATFRFGNGAPATRADLVDGARALVQGRFEANLFVTDAAVILRLGEAGAVSTEGVAYQVDTAARTLRVNRFQVAWSETTPIAGDATRLRTGALVRIEGTVVEGVLMASRLILRN